MIKSPILLIIIFTCSFALAQESKKIFRSGHQVDELINNNTNISYSLRKDSLLFQSRVSESSSDPQDYLVQFIDRLPTLSQGSQQKQAHSRSKLALEAHIQLREDISSFNQQNITSRSTTPAIEIKNEYSTAFYGAHLRMTKESAELIADLEYVEYVQIDRKFKINLDETTSIIGAKQVWEGFGVTGSGVTVGIIDTGIDYTHPALGGGFGPGFKVLGGYDFVNNDSDPFDDHSHGTHVAGIVAANTEDIQGVAPDASLFAIKVLDNFGYGSESNIIKGIEWTIDPNGDGDYSDRLDVVNMSLGGQGDAYDALSTAVNNAVNLGVTYIVAAGNDYNYWTIGSPASAEHAITVGASTNEDDLAYFSSKGPANGSLAIKPDLVAPGYEILSTVPNAQWDSYDGTSMASPHVAGVAALIKSLYPEKSPKEIKSMLVNSTLNLENLGPMEVGTGRVNAPAAISSKSIIYPTNLSFGKNQNELVEWVESVDVLIENQSDQTQNYSINNYNDYLGVQLNVNVNSFQLLSGESKTITFSLVVNNDTFEQPTSASLTVGDKVTIVSELDELSLAWAFISSSSLTIVPDNAENWSMINLVSHDYNYYDIYESEGNEFKVMVPPGAYNMIAWNQAWNKFVYRENIIVDGDTRVDLSESDAKNKLTLYAEDENGIEFETYSSQTSLLMNLPYGLGSMTSYGGMQKELFFSDLPEEATIIISSDKYEVKQEGIDVYFIPMAHLSGLNSNMEIKKTASNLNSTDLIFYLPEGKEVKEIILFDYVYYVNATSGKIYPSMAFGSALDTNISNNLFLKYYTTEQTYSSDTEGNILTRTFEFNNHDEDNFLKIEARNLSLYNGKIGCYETLRPSDYAPSIVSGEVMEFGKGLKFPKHYLYDSNLPTRISDQAGAVEQFSYTRPQFVYSNDGENFFAIKTGQFENEQEYQLKYTSKQSMEFSNAEPILMEFCYLINEEGKLVEKLFPESSGKIIYGLSSSGLSMNYARTLISSPAMDEPIELSTEILEANETLSVYSASIDNLAIGNYDFSIVAENELLTKMEWNTGKTLSIDENVIPVIKDQNVISIGGTDTYRFSLNDLIIEDSDNAFPIDFEIVVDNMENNSFKVENGVFMPKILSKSKHEVEISVSDGIDTSESFPLNIHVGNEVPIILSQIPIYIKNDSALTFNYNMIEVLDADNTYPNDFTMGIVEHWWDEFTIESLTIIPKSWASYRIYPEIFVNDGIDKSANYQVKVDLYQPSVVPLIIGQKSMDVEQGVAFSVDVNSLVISDTDSEFPNAFEIIYYDYYNYKRKDGTITFSSEVEGTNYVYLSVTDGTHISDVYYFRVNVVASSVNETEETEEPAEFEVLGSTNIYKETKIYPNPAEDELKISSNHPIFLDQIKIVSVSGQEFFGHKMTRLQQNEVLIDISMLKPGLYMLQLGNGSLIERKKIRIN